MSIGPRRRRLGGMVIVAALVVAGCTGDDPTDASPTAATRALDDAPAATPSTTASSTTTSPPLDVGVLPEVPSDTLLALRREALHPSLWPELETAIVTGDDIALTVSGTLFGDVAGDDWRLCHSIDESWPPQCGDGLAIDPAPTIATASTSVDVYPGGPRVIDDVQLTGWFLADSLTFREDPNGASADAVRRLLDDPPAATETELPTESGAVSTFTESLGPLWVVRHADDTVSAVPGWVLGHDRVDESGTDGGRLGDVVMWSPAEQTFVAGDRSWDEQGRSAGDWPDLDGLGARIGGTRVEVFEVATAAPDTQAGGLAEPLRDRPTDLQTPTLGDAQPLSAWPVPRDQWSVVDARLAPDGLCSVQLDAMPEPLGRCPGVGAHVDVETAWWWFDGPVLVGEFVTGRIVVPAGDAIEAPKPLEAIGGASGVLGVDIRCDDGSPIVEVGVGLPEPLEIRIEVVHDRVVVGEATVTLPGGPPVPVPITIAASPPFPEPTEIRYFVVGREYEPINRTPFDLSPATTICD